MQLYLAAAGAPPQPPTFFWTSPLGTKFTQNRTRARTVRKGARASAPKREKADLWGAKGAERRQTGAKTEAKWSQKWHEFLVFLENEEMCSRYIICYV